MTRVGKHLVVSVQGLTFNDVIYYHEVPEDIEHVTIKVSDDYKTSSHEDATNLEIKMDAQQSRSLSGEELEYVQENFNTYVDLKANNSMPKMVFTEEYTTGSICAITKVPRRIKVFYYCDEFAGY